MRLNHYDLAQCVTCQHPRFYHNIQIKPPYCGQHGCSCSQFVLPDDFNKQLTTLCSCGHDWEHHNAQTAVCEEPGCPCYKFGEPLIKSSPQPDVEAVMRNRHELYGSYYEAHIVVGRVWSAILSQRLGQPIGDLDPDLVATMMAALKLCRMSNPGYHEDNYLDAHGYVEIAQRCAQRMRTDGNEK